MKGHSNPYSPHYVPLSQLPAMTGGKTTSADLIDRLRALHQQTRLFESISVVDRNRFETIYVYDFLVNNVSITVAQDVVNFTVPRGRVAEIERIAVFYSEPVINQGAYFGWRLAVNSERVPNVGRVTADFTSGSYGDLYNPVAIQPIYAQAGETVQLQVLDQTGGGLNERLVISGLLSGRLYFVQGVN